MLPADPSTEPAAASPPHESARASLLRANTAVAVIIGTVLLLALGALAQSRRATRLQAAAHEQQQRAETAEASARADLSRALLAEARATRLGQTLGRRTATLESLGRAAAIAPTPELRNEAVATLALPERRLESTLPLDASVRSYEFDPTLQRCALGLTNGDVVIRRMTDGAEIRRLRAGEGGVPAAQGAPVTFDFSPDGRLLSVRYVGGALAAWEVESGTLRFVVDADARRRPASRGMFSSDGQFVVAPVFTPDGFAVMETAGGGRVAHFPQAGSFHHGAVRPGARQFAAYDGDKVLLLDWETRQQVLALPFDFGVYRLAWSPDGRWLGVFGNSLEIQLWDVDRRQMRALHGHRDVIHEASFDPAGERLSGQSYDGASRIWNLRDGRVMDVSTDGRLLRWGPEGRTGWLTPRKRLEVWREQSGAGYRRAPAAEIPFDPQKVDVSPDGNWAVGVAEADGLLVWPLNPPGPARFHPLSAVQSVCFDPVKPQLLVIRDHGLETFDWSVAQESGQRRFQLGASVASMPVPNRQIDRVTCSADGRTRAFVNLPAGAIWVQRPAEPDIVVALQDILHSSVVSQTSSPQGAGTIALSPDGQWLVCGADGQGVRVFDTRTGRPVKLLDPQMRGVQFSADGRWLVLNGPPDCVLIRTADWSEAWRKRHDSYIYQHHGSVAVSPDGSRVAYVAHPGRIELVEAATGRELARLESPSGSPPITLRWPARGSSLVVATREHSLDVWQPAALQHELAGLGLDWAAPASPTLPGTARGSFDRTGFAGWLSVGILITAGVVALLALGSLRRHRRLIEEFTATEELALRRKQELEIEREVGRLKTRFVSLVSHEFRTPLGIIMSAVELLRNYQDRLPAGKRDELHADIYGSTRHMAGLMEQVLVLGRVEGGNLGFKPAPIDLVTLCGKFTDESLSATNHRCRIALQIEGTLAGARGDEALLRHIFSNLLSNGVKYSPPGSTVEFTIRRDGNDAVFTVRDQGIGIPETDLPHLFEAFRRASNVGETPGTGLGMLIVKRCVELQGGRLDVASKVGEGTTVTVRLPVFASV